MEITFFGIVWIFLIFYSFVRKKLKIAVLILLFSMIFQCNNVFVVSGKGIGPQLITSLFFILHSFCFNSKDSNSRRYTIVGFVLIWLLFLIYAFVNSYIFGTISDQAVSLISVSVYFICFLRCYKMSALISNKQLFKYIKSIYLFLIVLGPIQLLCTLHFLPKSLLASFFYNDISENVYFHTTSRYFRILGSFMEPSYLAGILVGFLFFFMLNKEHYKISGVYIILGLVELVFTFSSTGYLVFISLFLLFIISTRNIKIFKQSLPIIILLSVFAYYTKDTILNDVLFDKLNSSSGVERTRWNNMALDLFFDNPVWGSGYGMVRASSFAISLLANLGIVGFALYIIQFLYLLSKIIFNSLNTFQISTVFIVISVSLSQLVACPDLHLCTFWLSLYIFSLGLNINKNVIYRV